MKKIAITVLCMIIVLSITACAQDRTVHNNIEKTEEASLELNFFGNKTEAVNTQAIEEIMHAYMDENPKINITYESIKGDDYFDILKKRLDSGNGDDIFIVNHDTMLDFDNKGYLADLSDLAQKIDYQEIIENQINTNDNRVLSLPSTISAFGLYCNMDLLKEYDVKVPKNKEEFLEALKIFKKNNIVPLSVNNDISLKTVALAISMYPIYQSENSTALLTELNNDPEKMSDQMKEGYTFVKQLIEEGYIDVELAKTTSKTKDDLNQFASGSYPFMLTGVWANSRVKLMEPDFKYTIQPYPLLEDGSLLVVNADSRIALNANGKNIEEAKKFIAFFMEQNNIQIYANSQDSLSPLKSKQHSVSNDNAHLQTYLDKKQVVIGSDELFQFPIWDISKDCIQMLMNGDSVDDALTYMKNTQIQYLAGEQ